MRHRLKRLKKFNSGIQKRQNLIRNSITSLIRNGEMTTTYKRGKVLKSEVDSFLSGLVKLFEKYNTEEEVKREAIRKVKDLVYTEEEGKKIVNELLPRYKEEGKNSGFVNYYRVGFRKGDGGEKVLLRLT